MPNEIIMCMNRKCTRRTRCYRYMAIPNMIQYFDEFAHVQDFKRCDFFIKIGDKKIRGDYTNKKDSETISEP